MGKQRVRSGRTCLDYQPRPRCALPQKTGLFGEPPIATGLGLEVLMGGGGQTFLPLPARISGPLTETKALLQEEQEIRLKVFRDPSRINLVC